MQLLSLKEFFSEECIYRVPSYQRGYSWETKQLNELWQDIRNNKNKDIHYTGVLTLTEMADNEKIVLAQKENILKDNLETKKVYNIVDGQQRLTTFIILLFVISKYIDKKEEIIQIYIKDNNIYKFGYEKDDPSYEYLKSYIFEEESLKIENPTQYTKNLKSAKLFFENKFKDKHSEHLKDIYYKIISNFKINEYILDKQIGVGLAFETINNRGKPLSNLELLKNRLMFILEKENDRNNKLHYLSVVHNTWKTIYEYLGKDRFFDKKISDDKFLKDYTIIKFEKNNNKRENYLKKFISDIKESLKEDREYTDDDFLRDYWIMKFHYSRERKDDYKDFLFNKVFSMEPEDKYKYDMSGEGIRKHCIDMQSAIEYWYYIQNPTEMNEGEYEVIHDKDIVDLLYELNRLGLKEALPLLTSAFVKKIEKQKMIEVLQAIIQYNFKNFDFSKLKANAGTTIIYKMARELFDREKTIDTIRYEIEESIEARINSFIYHINEVKNGFHGWSGIKYILYEYERYLNEKNKNDVKLAWGDNTIEHIYPQNPRDGDWECFEKYTEEQRLKLQNSFGNLLLLGKGKNSSLGNRSFKKKKTGGDLKNPSYNMGSLSEREVAKNEDWIAQEILNRGIDLLDFMFKKFKINNVTEKEKIDILGLDFMNEIDE